MLTTAYKLQGGKCQDASFQTPHHLPFLHLERERHTYLQQESSSPIIYAAYIHVAYKWGSNRQVQRLAWKYFICWYICMYVVLVDFKMEQTTFTR